MGGEGVSSGDPPAFSLHAPVAPQPMCDNAASSSGRSLVARTAFFFSSFFSYVGLVLLDACDPGCVCFC